MSRIDDLMDQLAALPGASVGRGPRHPTEPDTELERRIARFLDENTRLRSDAGYVEFLEKYAGASIQNDDFSQIVDFLGFSEASTDIEEMDGPIVDRNGFLMIAEAVYHLRDGDRNTGTLQHALAYDVTGDRPTGLYHSLVSPQRLQPEFTLKFQDFEEALKDIVSREGWLDPPGHP